jgi:hypothetical protein
MDSPSPALPVHHGQSVRSSANGPCRTVSSAGVRSVVGVCVSEDTRLWGEVRRLGWRQLTALRVVIAQRRSGQNTVLRETILMQGTVRLLGQQDDTCPKGTQTRGAGPHADAHLRTRPPRIRVQGAMALGLCDRDG